MPGRTRRLPPWNELNDLKLPALKQAYYNYLHFNGLNAANIAAGQNDAIWFLVCQQNPGLCPSAMYLSLWRSFMPGGTGTGPLAAGVFFVGQGGGNSAVWRNLADPESMVGATLEEVRALVPTGWIERPLNKGGLSGPFLGAGLVSRV
jgi:hypothetical protein